MIKFGIIGAGWRSKFYLRIAMLVPEIFSVSGIYIRNPEKRIEFSKKYDVNMISYGSELNMIKDGCVKILKKVKTDGNTVRLSALQPKIKKLFLICSLNSIMEIE